MCIRYRLALSIYILLGALCGCGSDTQSEQPIDKNEPIPMEITILNEGNQPLIGNAGIKKMAIVDNETDFELLWFDYTSDNIPTIDFQTDIVVLYDMGGERNLDSSCGNKVSLTNLTAEKIDISVSQINVNLSKDCPLPPDSPCLPVVLPGRPYIIASAPRNSEVLISENMTFLQCN